MFSKEYSISVASQADINLNLRACNAESHARIRTFRHYCIFSLFYDELVVTTKLVQSAGGVLHSNKDMQYCQCVPHFNTISCSAITMPPARRQCDFTYHQHAFFLWVMESQPYLFGKIKCRSL